MNDLYLDFDGTVCDVSERYYQVYKDIMTDLGQPILSKECYWECKRRRLPEDQILGLTTDHRLLFSRYQDQRGKLLEDPAYLSLDRPVLPQVHQILNDLGQRHRLHLVTLRRNRDSLHEQVRNMNLYHYFQYILIPDRAWCSNVPIWIFKANLIRGVWSTHCSGIVVGDTEADILAGKELSFKTYAVLSGMRCVEFLAELSPDLIVENISKLIGYE